jgi:spore coat protein CotH
MALAAMRPGRRGASSLGGSEVRRSAPLYDMQALRTLFFQFDDADWEQELMDFHNTDVDIPATLVVDGQTRDVGIHFRGMSSFSGVPAGLKHSINVSIDFRHDTQQLLGYRTLNLLNSHEDPTFLRSVLYYEAAREYVPAPKSNFVRVAINGESWGVYVNAEQFNKDMIKEWFNTTDGARWKVPGSPGGRGGLEYLGDNPGAYKSIYEIKSKDAKSWADLMKLCRVLNETPPDQLEAALAPTRRGRRAEVPRTRGRARE